MIRRPPRSTLSSSSAASDVYKRQAKHNTAKDLWVAIDGDVYNLSKFAMLHPGGSPPLLEVAGTECTEAFYGLHRSSVLQEPRYAKLKIGTVTGWSAPRSTSEAEPRKLPYSQPMGTFRRVSPYYKQHHHDMRAAVRKIYDDIVAPTAAECDDKGIVCSAEKNKALGDAGLVATLIASEENGPALLKAWGIRLPSGLDPKDHDIFHTLVEHEESIVGVRGCYGVKDGLIGGCAGIGLPPLIKFGTDYLIENFAKPVCLGDKRICLAISEPYAGSDVSKIHTTATMHADGNWRVTGVKKWITGGMVADYFTTLVQTKEGFCMMLIERGDGMTVDTRPIKTSYSPAAGTSYVVFEEAVVPPENVIGVKGQGFYHAMANFNFERWGMVVSGNRHARLVLEECLKWGLQREVFGKKLIQQSVIRFKLGQMTAEIEVVHSLLEDITFQMANMSEKEINKYLAGPIALLKYKQSRVATFISDNACQIFGGRAITRTGMGNVVEKFQRSFKMMAILGGSEEIMCDFAMRQAMREATKGDGPSARP
eukprot:TRINITY_DN15305_c0_g1_i2.p1 TRINITY_DN15305_c0_g1~~TRINITY_DN15305_c0_g1_i2.p1  ORF type:complete len:538 (-),score=167.99 TRINITY_DN15305_c0_g1_i2:143-1756(-)